MGLCGEANDTDETKFYGVMPYIASEVLAIILFEGMDQNYNYETKREFDEAEEYRKANLSSVKNNPSTTHPQAIYISIT
ncbi:uncharacterized protein OCT59_016285 [Rhizophagus irregularis]|nr:hypothetical protein RirG_045860 [Rhizophagus irregularis DAOM 197198w]UZO23956.1 hypothetical protein OCT59_016285 [Rhizophagus irregularis]GBC31303.1 kinase-like domain-containing protein [Rhizophagus irregularis DAOM 181602=DAOM 197198]